MSSKNYLFHGRGIVNVTNFDVNSPDDPLGYLCSCDISVLKSGQIEIHSDDAAQALLESFSVSNIVGASNNINNYDPNHITDVSLITNSKDLRITFQTQESKNEFWRVFSALY